MQPDTTIYPQWLIMLAVLLGLCLGVEIHTVKTELRSGWSMVEMRPDVSTVPKADWNSTAMPKPDFLPNPGVAAGIWYRRPLAPMANMDRDVFLEVEQGLYAPELFVDGVKVDAWTDGWTPHRALITRYVCDGKPHELLIHFHDRNAANKDGVVFNSGRGEDSLRGMVVFPLGGYKDLTGMMAPVSLITVPKSRIDEGALVIHTSFRKKIFEVTGRVDKPAPDSRVELKILSRVGKVVGAETVPVDQRGLFRWKTALPHVQDWAPEHPALYTLETTLSSAGKTIHRADTRFGFKEIWTEGPDFYLNGVKRHFLATSTWPVAEHLTRIEIRRRLQKVKALGCNAIRLHLCPWQPDFLNEADELGLMVVDEAPVYTDGSGFYAYQDPQFWSNYREVIQGEIERDRNHACLMMWSLGNEIRFMGNERYDSHLPQKQGDLARFAHRIDPYHPVTFEADQDPDGAFDVIGLHYPHELPYQDDYPVTCDWLAQHAHTDALGGMLGTKSTDFVWDRKKPLYIGEYLWVPFGDYSPATVFFGEDAYRNRAQMNARAIAESWIEQTLGYRRAGVSGLCPWTSFSFGFERANPTLSDAQAFSMRHLAAYLRTTGHRGTPGSEIPFDFDVFNDTDADRALTLRVSGMGQRYEKPVVLNPGSTALVAFKLRCPPVPALKKWTIRYELRSAGKVVGQGSTVATVMPAAELKAPAGWAIQFVTDRDSLPITPADLAHTIVVVAKDALPHALSLGLKDWIERGGRAFVLEQKDLTAFGVRVIDHSSTMAFPAGALYAEDPEALKFWSSSLYVAHRQIARTGVGGWRSLAVTGGQNGLALSPSMGRAFGKGWIVLSQWSFSADDPACKSVCNKAIDWLCRQAIPLEGKVLVLGASRSQRDALERISLNAKFVEDNPTAQPIAQPIERDILSASGLVICGSTPSPGIEGCVRFAEAKGWPIFRWSPTAASFDQYKSVLGASEMQLAQDPGIPTLSDRASPVLQGLTREELTLTTPPANWNHSISVKLDTTFSALVPVDSVQPVERLGMNSFHSEAGLRVGREIHFDRPGTLGVKIGVSKDGLYKLSLAAGIQSGEGRVLLNVFVNGEQVGIAALEKTVDRDVSTWASLHAGVNDVEFNIDNGADYGGGPVVAARQFAIAGPMRYPNGVDVLATPGAITTWSVGKSRVILSCFRPETDIDNRSKCDLTLGALLGNLGMPFQTP